MAAVPELLQQQEEDRSKVRSSPPQAPGRAALRAPGSLYSFPCASVGPGCSWPSLAGEAPVRPGQPLFFVFSEGCPRESLWIPRILTLAQEPVPSGLGERISGDPGMFILKLPSASW
uniref:Sorting nexin 5 n=2 Tax=Rhinopithecus TaxID=542827 RepID=A0A2K6N164_RHIBE